MEENLNKNEETLKLIQSFRNKTIDELNCLLAFNDKELSTKILEDNFDTEYRKLDIDAMRTLLEFYLYMIEKAEDSEDRFFCTSLDFLIGLLCCNEKNLSTLKMHLRDDFPYVDITKAFPVPLTKQAQFDVIMAKILNSEKIENPNSKISHLFNRVVNKIILFVSHQNFQELKDEQKNSIGIKNDFPTSNEEFINKIVISQLNWEGDIGLNENHQ